jgi:predicted transcriptional regulator of viral defense system
MAQETLPEVDIVADRPSWDRLYEIASSQSGLFASEQAAEAGFSAKLLHKHLRSGNLSRPHRGIYRIIRFPPGEQEDLVVAWLWSHRKGALSHETALALHGLSDALPARLHLTIPKGERRTHPPELVVVYQADLAAADIDWVGQVPVTTAARSIRDVAAAHGDFDIVNQAIQQAIARGLASAAELRDAIDYGAMASGDLLRPGVVREPEPARIERWNVLRLSGTVAREPPPDWRTDVQAIAGQFGAVSAAERYQRDSKTLSFELRWRDGKRSGEEHEILAVASRRFGWR